MTDNKDLQITPELVERFINLPNASAYAYEANFDGGKIKIMDIAQAYLQQAAELSQLRAERAGLENKVTVLNSIVSFVLEHPHEAPSHVDTWKAVIKSKLTDASSSKGRTPDFDSGNCGSNPQEADKLTDAAQSIKEGE